jgi:spectrin beta
MLENDIQGHQGRIDDIQRQVRGFADSNHFMIARIDDKGRELLTKYCNLEDPMSNRLKQLENSLKLHKFTYGVQDELNWIREREHQTASVDLGNNLTSVQKLLAKHEALLMELQTHEGSIVQSTREGNELLNNGHFASDRIEENLQKLTDAWNSLNEQAKGRSKNLSDSLHLQQYYAKATETESWIKDKAPLAASDEYGKDENSTLGLMKKHEAFQLELDSYRPKIKELEFDSTTMINAGHYESTAIQDKQRAMGTQYEELVRLSALRQSRLLETKDLHEFNRECDEVTKWIREKEVTACSEETGRDLEHVEALQKRFADFARDLMSSSERIEQVMTMSSKLLSDGHTDSAHILEHREIINHLWENLKKLIDIRTKVLATARKIHTFNRDANDLVHQITEKMKALQGVDYGKDLASVQSLQKKHEGYEHDLAPLEQRITQLSKDAHILSSAHPESSAHIGEKEHEATSAWRELIARSHQRKQKLLQAEELQRYLNEFRDLSLWLVDMKTVILADEAPHDVNGAEELIQRLLEHKTEIDARKNSFTSFLAKGKKLVDNNHYAKDEIQNKMKYLDTAHKQLLGLWEERRENYEENLDILKFYHDAEQGEAWINTQQALLKVDDFGESLDAVEEMLKSHADFEKMVMRQEDRFQQLTRETKVEFKERRKREEEEERRLKEEEERQRELQRQLEMQRQKQQEMEMRRQREMEEEQKQREMELQRQKEMMEEKKKREEEAKQMDEGIGVGQPARVGPKKPPPLEETSKVAPIKHSVSASSGVYDIPRGTSRGEMQRYEGFLQRKNELDEGGRKATVRSWKQYYCMLNGSLLQFYKDRKDAQQNNQACHPINVSLGTCNEAKDYKKKNSFRLTLLNGAEYLFMTEQDDEAIAWITYINSAITTSSKAYESNRPHVLSKALSAAKVPQGSSPLMTSHEPGEEGEGQVLSCLVSNYR